MELEYFEVQYKRRIHPIPKREFTCNGNLETEIEIWDSTIEPAKILMSITEIKYITISTSTIEFLKDAIFEKIIGLRINGRIKNLNPIKSLSNLRTLSIFTDDDLELDFSTFPNLLELYCRHSKYFKNLKFLNNLRVLQIDRYKKCNCLEFQEMKDLRKLTLSSSVIENLKGLENLANLEMIKLDECKKLNSLQGLTSNNRKLSKIEIHDCYNLKAMNLSGELGNQLQITRNGDLVSSIQNYEEQIIAKLEENLVEIGTDRDVITSIKNQLVQLKLKSNPKNWKNKLKQFTKSINLLNNKNGSIYTEERNEIIKAVEYILIDHDVESIKQILEQYRNW